MSMTGIRIRHEKQRENACRLGQRRKGWSRMDIVAADDVVVAAADVVAAAGGVAAADVVVAAADVVW